ncbi:MAG: 4-hydroxythreonine-4-phosphate dehydrogenase [Pelagibacterales bacterium]|nr:4-hydroxythreonine-4-phosphate dehydrogenase [Pelagibacterales bacterium]
MIKPIAIVAGEPNSISSEIIFKTWKLKKKYAHKPFFIIGSVRLLEQQSKYLKIKISIKEIDKDFSIQDLSNKDLPVYNVNYKQKKAFEKVSIKSNSYIFKCFETARRLIKEKKIIGFINCPVSKETLFKKKNHGVTEYLSRKDKKNNHEVMLIYNKQLSVAPLTTHIPLGQVSKKINRLKIEKKVKTINNFYKNVFKKKPKIAILGLNPHNFSPQNKSEEKKIIIPAIKNLKKAGIKAVGPVSPDTSFVIHEKYKYDVIFGMYHDQVLTPFKTLFKYEAINITLGLSYIRVSPDHGIAQNIVSKNIANPYSLIESVKFFNKINN